jgi:hypothetical protein
MNLLLNPAKILKMSVFLFKKNKKLNKFSKIHVSTFFLFFFFSKKKIIIRLFWILH